MKVTIAILSLALLLALSAGAYLGNSLHQEKMARSSLEETMRDQAADPEREIQRLDQSARQLDAQLSDLKSDLFAAKARAIENANELSALRGKNAELQNQAAKANERLQFEFELRKQPHYDTAAQIMALPTCTLTDAQNHTCSAGFKDSAGRSFYIGGPGASREVAGFINSLEEGKTYTLPAAFAEYQKKNPPKPAKDE